MLAKTSRAGKRFTDRCNPGPDRHHLTVVRSLAWIALASCGNDHRPDPIVDAPPEGTPIVAITSPRRNESYYVSQSIAVSWSVDDDGPVTCDVKATDGGASIEIATSVAVAASGSTSWSLAGVAPSESYTIEVRCTDTGVPPLIGAATSGAFAIAEAPQQVSFAAQVVPLLASCTSNQCHDATNPAQSLELTAGRAYAELVGPASTQCSSLQLVNPGQPNDSYLVAKLAGTGPCFQGTRMPKPPETVFTQAQLQTVRDWIANGAPNN
jgi:hypothetical protein